MIAREKKLIGAHAVHATVALALVVVVGSFHQGVAGESG